MAIILYHTNTTIPDHLKDCVAKIRQYSNIPIYLLTDCDYNIATVKVVNINKYNEFKWLQDLDYFRGNDAMSHMWRTSCFRIFYIQKFMEEETLNDVLHFDNDVLLYEKPETLIEKISTKYNGFAITAHNSGEIVFGMSYIKNTELLSPITRTIKKELLIPTNELKKKYGGYPSEMQIIARAECEYLPILPTGLTDPRYTANFQHFNSVFDPSSYGQYIAGTYAEKQPGWFGTHQEIGKFIGNSRIRVIFEDRNPFVLFEGNRIKINNLHIHSKDTGKYL